MLSSLVQPYLEVSISDLCLASADSSLVNNITLLLLLFARREISRFFSMFFTFPSSSLAFL